MGRFTYEPSIGPAQYRRTLYTFWRRSSAPTFLFDSAMRRTCEVVPRRTNTPLHALTLLNDTTALEAARRLAEKQLADSSLDGFEQRLHHMFQTVLSRPPSGDERKVLYRGYQSAIQYYGDHPDEAQSLTGVGQLRPVAKEQAGMLAAEMLQASMILNLDESITHE